MNDLDINSVTPSNLKDEFIFEPLENIFRYFEGDPDRYAQLLPWAITNDILTNTG